MGDDMFEEISPLYLRPAPVPTALHHLHLLVPSRGIIRRFVGLGEMRSDVIFPVLDGVECVIEGHLYCAATTPETLHPPCGREGYL